VTILADSAEQADEIDVDRAERARQQAEEIMRTGVKDDPDRIAAVRASLLRAEARVNVGRRRRRASAAGRRTDSGESG
jgi:F-type H+-transporting ATPase subunit epsilon